MADLVNGLRESLGVGALSYDARIAAVARRWSQVMGAEQYFGHNPTFAEEYPPGWVAAGENIAGARRSIFADGVTLAELLDEVRASFDGLVDSPGHYANMTNPQYTHLGIGVAVDNGAIWITQNFARYPEGTIP